MYLLPLDDDRMSLSYDSSESPTEVASSETVILDYLMWLCSSSLITALGLSYF